MAARPEPRSAKAPTPEAIAARRPAGAKPPKLLAEMRANPRGDWSISDVEALCRQVGLTCASPTRGTHYKVSSPLLQGIQVIPHKRPIKPTYIRQLVSLAQAHMQASQAQEDAHG